MLSICALEVHIWRCALDGATAELATPLLDAAELAQAARFHFDRHRMAFVAARGWQRRLLSRYTGQPAAALRWTRSAYGRPALEHGAGLDFNLAHSGDWMLLAVTRDCAVGVDIEAWRELDVQALASSAFSPTEQAQLTGLPAALQVAGFFQGWASKEAFIKALGLGLSHPLDSFDTQLDPRLPLQLLATRPDPAEARRWRLHALAAPNGYTAALCCAAGAALCEQGQARW